MATSPTTDSVTQLLGTIKETYTSEVEKLRVSEAVLQEMYPVDKKSLIGNAFHVPLLTTFSQSTTYDVSQGSKTLTTATAPQSVDAQIPARELSERWSAPYGLLAQAALGNSVSFVSKATLELIACREGLVRQVEQSLLYGGQSFGTVSGAGSVSSTTLTGLTLAAGSFSPAYLSGCENAPIDVYASNDSTKRNANAPVIITSVSVDPTTGVATLNLSGNNTDLNAISASSDHLWRYGENGFAMTGLMTQLANTATTLFVNMDPTKYTVLKGNVVAGVGNIAISKVLKYAALAKNKGLKGEAVFLCGPDVFSALANDLVTQRRYDGSYNKGKLTTGAETIEIRAGGVVIAITEHLFMKSGECALFGKDSIMRPAVADISSEISGMDFAVMSSTTNAFEQREWTSQAIFCAAPARGFVLQGVTVP